jgi:hypothetical protein
MLGCFKIRRWCEAAFLAAFRFPALHQSFHNTLVHGAVRNHFAFRRRSIFFRTALTWHKQFAQALLKDYKFLTRNPKLPAHDADKREWGQALRPTEAGPFAANPAAQPGPLIRVYPRDSRVSTPAFGLKRVRNARRSKFKVQCSKFDVRETLNPEPRTSNLEP